MAERTVAAVTDLARGVAKEVMGGGWEAATAKEEEVRLVATGARET